MHKTKKKKKKLTGENRTAQICPCALLCMCKISIFYLLVVPLTCGEFILRTAGFCEA